MKDRSTMTASYLAMSIAACFVLMAPVSAQAPDRGEAFLLDMTGAGAWEVACQLSQGNGDGVAKRALGRDPRDNGRFSVADVVSGLCTYSVPARGELLLTLHVAHTQLECPFTVTEAGFCRAYFLPGETGSFTIQRHSTPVTTGT